MFVYLSKKISIPNGINLKTIAWNNDQGWIACGGTDGLLKVLKLESNSNSSDKKGKGSNLSMNQTLDGHGGSVLVASWNPQYHKLATSDENGLIIVWILYKGTWYEEMINNRNKSVVTDIQWNKTGEKIGIIYKDGAVIIGSVDGSRIWGKELDIELLYLQWSPDSKFILFCTVDGELHLYDADGNFISKVPTYFNETGVGVIKISGCEWYNGLNGYIDQDVPCLAVALENGKIQLMRNEKDNESIIIDTAMRYLNIKWNRDGSLLAVTGMQYGKSSQGENKEVCVLQIYDAYGKYLRSLRVPGKRITALSWENSGLHIALAIDSFIYFANVRPNYKWTSLSKDVIAYAYSKPNKSDTYITFWNSKTNEKYTKLYTKVLSLISYDVYCLIVTKSTVEENQYIFTVVNSIGTPIHTKIIDFEPVCYGINKTRVYVASTDTILYYQFKSSTNGSNIAYNAIRKKELQEYSFNIDDIKNIGTSAQDVSFGGYHINNDPIIQIAVSDLYLVVARQSGALLQFSLPNVVLENQYFISHQPQHMQLNCDSTMLSLIDNSGILKIFSFSKSENLNSSSDGLVKSTNDIIADTGKLLEFERKDVWEMKWSEDTPDSFVVLEKTRVIVFNNCEPEEPVSYIGNIFDFRDLEIKIVQIDEIMKSPDAPSKDFISIIETKHVREIRRILEEEDISKAFEYAETNSIPRLWKIISFSALNNFNFDAAEKAFAKCQDYQGLQFIKSLKKLNNKDIQRAEIATYSGNIELAEKIYIEIDRMDLALNLRMLLGDWFRVVYLIQSGDIGDDVLLNKALNSIGDYYYEHQRWSQALNYYVQGRNVEKLIQCYYLLEDYSGLEKLMNSLPDNDTNFKTFGDIFKSSGMCNQAVKAYLKTGDVKSAIDTCVYLNQWSDAIELADKHNFKDIETLLSGYAKRLLNEKKIIEAIELYRKANYCQKSAQLLYNLADEFVKQNKSPLQIKKLYVLAALEVERYHQLNKFKGHKKNNDEALAALEGLLVEDSKNMMNTKFLDNAWKGAEAYHFYILAQQQYYQGDLDAAIKTAKHLCEYDDIIDPKKIYCLLALISFHNRCFATCSKAFVKLESLQSLSEQEKDDIEKLAVSIFTKFVPEDPPEKEVECTNCGSLLKESESYCSSCHLNFPICIVTGKPIIEPYHFMCHVCKRRAIEREISGLQCCPLCHTTL